ncbi:MAG: hypothetical protein H6594_07345 [Flavobacteriales bacterium]|nr:hypothetical protein [Flavobacteriales bacterium]
MRSIMAVCTMFLLLACGTGKGDLCEKFFMPYPDMVSGRLRTDQNAALLDAMASYSKNDFSAAAKGLEDIVRIGGRKPQERVYLASCYLALGRPFDAEYQLDRIESAPEKDYKDVADWYYALCWLCSGQLDRALEQACRIADAPAHTYKQHARDLVEALTP